MSEVVKICERLLNDAQKVEPDVATGCILCGTLSKFSDKFFEVDPPIVPRGDEGVVCWRTQLQDATGSIIVRVWNKARSHCLVSPSTRCVKNGVMDMSVVSVKTGVMDMSVMSVEPT